LKIKWYSYSINNWQVFGLDLRMQKVYIDFSTQTERVLKSGAGGLLTQTKRSPVTFSIIWRFENGKKTIQG
jgi:hypothetical protein